jgi:hypothetical protein
MNRPVEFGAFMLGRNVSRDTSNPMALASRDRTSQSAFSDLETDFVGLSVFCSH